MSASACASSLVLPSLSPKTLSLFTPKPFSLSFCALSSTPLKLQANLICVSASRGFGNLSSRFVRNVISSDLGLGEGVLSDTGASSFSPDLKLFVGNLPFSVDSAQLAGLFESAGNVEMVIYDKTTGRSRGFGFVTMSTIEEVEAAAQQFNGYVSMATCLMRYVRIKPSFGTMLPLAICGCCSWRLLSSLMAISWEELDGRPLRVNYGPPPSRGDAPRGGRGSSAGYDSSNRVYVGNLSWGVDNDALETLFSEQGKVLDARVVYDRESGRSRGFGFVTYNTAEEVISAIESLNGVDLNGREIRVTPAESRPRRSF
ncbi:hypothetical protein FEM48_Zijuj12G0171200 [Ziziphus jujuba var. spinosa]|uniref:RRM domain-containing protein n=1 Tax=Ziziphus jujuba var. spinosa TaxID=714518 RepID=A0A978UEK7_ZIZJJ|nr:hypothetical protein FEM48_Zijuj12G0171200 [Ziziphus jujuba var. spinosa]